VVSVLAPASCGNLGAGFDALSLAIDLCNAFSAEPADELVIENIGEGAERLPAGREHLVYRAIERVYGAAGRAAPALRLRCENRIPLSRGLGSSSSAIVAGLLLGNRLLGEPLDETRLLALATQMEGHPDNVVACLLGGIQVSVLSGSSVLTCPAAVPPSLQAVLFVPNFVMDTHAARQLLPSRVPLADAVFNLSRSALLVAALANDRLDLLRTATEDQLHQPPRTALFPAMPRMFEAALEAGALGACLSGAGSSILALATDRLDEIAVALEACAARNAVEGSARIVAIRRQGATIVEG
jgi:homoserine kinase